MADKGVIMRCVIIAGSPDTNSDFLSEVIKPDDYVICADRGCNFAKQAGITPNLVVGDFDSEPDVLFPNCETVRLIPEKDDTDTMHSVDLALEKRFDEIAILGALGGRFDLGSSFFTRKKSDRKKFADDYNVTCLLVVAYIACAFAVGINSRTYDIAVLKNCSVR